MPLRFLAAFVFSAAFVAMAYVIDGDDGKSTLWQAIAGGLLLTTILATALTGLLWVIEKLGERATIFFRKVIK